MLNQINFATDTLSRQWMYVNRNYKEMGMIDPLDKFEDKAQTAIKAIIECSLEEEFKAAIKAGYYEHAPEREAKRKGHYNRILITTKGQYVVRVPRAKEITGIKYSVMDRYKQRREKFDNMIILSMMMGISQRKQRHFFREFVGTGVSHTTASNILKKIDDQVNEFRTQSLEDDYKYLILDGVWVSVKQGKTTKKSPVIFVIGIKTNGEQELLTFKLTKSESEEEVTKVLNDVYRRGVKGKKLRIISSDGAKGIRAAIEMVYPYAQWQSCYVHKLRNVHKNIRNKTIHRKKLMKQASNIYQADTRKAAVERYAKFVKTWQELEPKAVKTLTNGFNDTLTYYYFNEDRDLISTTNLLERYFEEIRRRIKIQGYFKNLLSLNRWMFGIAKYNINWITIAKGIAKKSTHKY